MFEQAYACNSCEAAIPAERARVHCQVCQDYNSCADCHVGELSGGNHCADYDYEVFMHGQRVLAKENCSTRTRTQGSYIKVFSGLYYIITLPNYIFLHFSFSFSYSLVLLSLFKGF